MAVQLQSLHLPPEAWPKSSATGIALPMLLACWLLSCWGHPQASHPRGGAGSPQKSIVMLDSLSHKPRGHRQLFHQGRYPSWGRGASRERAEAREVALLRDLVGPIIFEIPGLGSRAQHQADCGGGPDWSEVCSCSKGWVSPVIILYLRPGVHSAALEEGSREASGALLTPACQEP